MTTSQCSNARAAHIHCYSLSASPVSASPQAQADTSLHECLCRIEKKLTGVEGKITGLEGKITGLEGKITGLEGRITGLEERMTRLETKNN